MLSTLTGADLFNSIVMNHQLDPRPIIVLESPEDCGLTDSHINLGHIETLPGYGKPSVVEVATLATQNSISYVLPVIDADFERQTGATASLPDNLVLSEYYDLDCDAVFADPSALLAIAYNFADRTEVQSHLATLSMSVDELLVEIVSVIGALRLISATRRLSLNLRRLSVTDLPAAYARGDVVSTVLNVASARYQGTFPVTAAEVITELTQTPEPRRLCSGHDLFSVLAAFIKQAWSGEQVKSAFLEKVFRSGASCSTWGAIPLSRAISAWATDQSIDNPFTCPSVARPQSRGPGHEKAAMPE